MSFAPYRTRAIPLKLQNPFSFAQVVHARTGVADGAGKVVGVGEAVGMDEAVGAGEAVGMGEEIGVDEVIG